MKVLRVRIGLDSLGQGGGGSRPLCAEPPGSARGQESIPGPPFPWLEPLLLLLLTFPGALNLSPNYESWCLERHLINAFLLYLNSA